MTRKLVLSMARARSVLPGKDRRRCGEACRGGRQGAGARARFDGQGFVELGAPVRVHGASPAWQSSDDLGGTVASVRDAQTAVAGNRSGHRLDATCSGRARRRPAARRHQPSRPIPRAMSWWITARWAEFVERDPTISLPMAGGDRR